VAGRERGRVRGAPWIRGVGCGVGCGVVRCGVVRCGVVGCGIVGCGIVGCGVVGCGVAVSRHAESRDAGHARPTGQRGEHGFGVPRQPRLRRICA
jgi:hypothetical protein